MLTAVVEIHVHHSHTEGLVIAGVLGLVLAVAVAVATSPQLRPVRAAVLRTAAAVVGLFLVARGIAEFWVVNYSDAASYRHSWGGPSLVGVFIVHTGPGVLALAGIVGGVVRRRRPEAAPDMSSPTVAVG